MKELKIDFEDGSFLIIQEENSVLSLVQCAKNGNKVMMFSSRLSTKDAEKINEFLNNWLGKDNNE